MIADAGLADQQTASEQQIARASTAAALERLMSAERTETAAHLCCGVLGLTTLLRSDAEKAGCSLDPIVALAERKVFEQAQRNGCYTFFSLDNGSLNLPGLLTGKAGVALALLEAAVGVHWLTRVLSAGLL